MSSIRFCVLIIMFLSSFSSSVIYGEPETVTEREREVYRLAVAFEKSGRYRDALYYYRLLAEKSGETEIRINPGSYKSGKTILEEVIKRPEYRKLLDSKEYPNEKIVFSRVPNPPWEKNRNTWYDHASLIKKRLERNRTVYLFGADNHRFGVCSFETDTEGNLICFDENGHDLWRLRVPFKDIDRKDVTFSSSSTLESTNLFLKARNHLLYFVRGDTLSAIDPNGKNGPKIIWRRELESAFSGYSFYGASVSIPMLHTTAFSNTGTYVIGKPSDPIFIGPNVVSFRDLDTIYGLDPLSGETLWMRETNFTDVSFAGDEDFIYLYQDGASEVLILEARTGRMVRKSKVPENITHTFGSKALVIGPNGMNGIHGVLLYDLREILKPHEPESDDAKPVFRHKYRLMGLNHSSVCRISRSGRYLAVLKFPGFYILDVQTGKEIFSDDNTGGTGLLLETRKKYVDFDIEQIESGFLCTFIVDRDINLCESDDPRYGFNSFKPDYNRKYSIGLGRVMLYDRNGKPLWNEPCELKNCTRIAGQYPGFPVLLYGARISEREQKDYANFARSSVMLAGIDKATGKRLFSKQFGRYYGSKNKAGPGGSRMEELNDFFCTVEPEKNELSVTFPFVSIKARFTSSFENLIYVCKKEFYEFAATEYLDRFSMRSFFRLLENHLRELHPSMEKRLEELRKNAVRELEKPKEKQQSERYHRFLPFSR